jgi:hypothetical protein
MLLLAITGDSHNNTSREDKTESSLCYPHTIVTALTS